MRQSLAGLDFNGHCPAVKIKPPLCRAKVRKHFGTLYLCLDLLHLRAGRELNNLILCFNFDMMAFCLCMNDSLWLRSRDLMCCMCLVFKVCLC